MTEDKREDMAARLREPDNPNWRELMLDAADAIEALQRDNKMITDHLDDCVQERLEEINAEAEAYDKDASNTLSQICETLPEFDWLDYPEGLTTQDAYDRIMEHMSALEGTEAKLQRRVGDQGQALKKAAGTFRRYAVLHEAKCMPEADREADANRALAHEMEEALRSESGEDSDHMPSRDQLRKQVQDDPDMPVEAGAGGRVMSETLQDKAEAWLTKNYGLLRSDGHEKSLTGLLAEAYAQGRQEGFEEARERAAKAPCQGCKDASPYGRAFNDGVSAMRQAVRALQPKGSGSNG